MMPLCSSERFQTAWEAGIFIHWTTPTRLHPFAALNTTD